MKSMSLVQLLLILQLETINGMPEQWSPLCPQICSCEVRFIKELSQAQQVNWTKTVDCSNRNLHRIPRDLPIDAEAILLQNNSITMHVGLSQMPKLRMLNLSHNSIQGFFGRLLLPQLQHLDMGFNLISRVSHGDNDFFSPLKNLRSLSLQGNAIEAIDYFALELPILFQLDLSHNQLVTFSTELFITLPLLKIIDLSANRLTKFVSPNTDYDWIQLDYLNLLQNNLSTFVVKNLHVHTLLLGGNSFVSLNRRTFGGVDAKVADFSRINTLWAVRASAFIDCPSLHEVDFSGSQQLEYIEMGAFTNLLQLKKVNLNRTGVMHLPSELLSQNISLSHVEAPLSCHLNLEYFLTKNNATCVWRNSSIPTAQLPALIQSADWQQMPPTIFPTFPPSLETQLGSILEIQCQTTGNATKINWFRLDARRNREYPLPSSSGLLKAGPLYRVDSGLLYCRAINAYGSVNRSVKVSVTYAPVVLIPLAVTQQYITFAWNNSDPSIASQFRITYFEFSAWQNWTLIRMIFMEHLVRTYTISNLKPDTLYKLCISLNKSGNLDQLDCKNFTTKALEVGSRGFQAAHEVLIVIGCISSLLFIIFLSTCVYRFYQEKQQEAMSESLSRILLSDSSCMTSEASTPITYFNPGVDPLTPTTDLDIRAAFLPPDHPYRMVPFGFGGRYLDLPLLNSSQNQLANTTF